MTCEDGSPVDRLVCAIQSLEPEWWEQWLPVIALLVSVAAPFAVASWVAKRSRADTLAAVQRQIEASRQDIERQIDAGRESTMNAVERQISAERDHLERERIRQKIEDFRTASSRQVFIRSMEERREGIRDVDRAAGALGLALPVDIKTAVEPWLDKCVGLLLDSRILEKQGEQEADGRGDGLVAQWVGTSITLAQRLFRDEVDLDGLRGSASRAAERMQAAVEKAERRSSSTKDDR